MNRMWMAAALALLVGWPPGAVAQGASGFPSKPLRMIVPFPPGGPTDVLGRVVGQGLADAWQQSSVTDNRTGAAGNIGIDALAKAAGDGHTMGIVPAGNIAVNPALYPNLPYRAADLAPVAMLATVHNVLVVNAEVPARNLNELLALARSQPGKLSFASPGAGSQAHLAGELLQVDTGVQLIHVPYKGTGPALNDLVGGQVTMMFAQLSSALPQIKAGKLRAIGLASARRHPLMPELPTLIEQGVAKFEAVSWYALMVPAGTPRDVIEKLSAETGRVLAKPDTREKLLALGLDVEAGTPQALAATIRSETERWSALIRKQNIRAE